ncbi:transcriptional repressor (plasmid) [Polymorphobacter sp. PAMC 29334]|nr:transcriptional repressor [Polymorphobacter sp. PAMC 29334]QYE37290.1 transcriptional repressor [Polymorphobacter sp. PAMC 29334]
MANVCAASITTSPTALASAARGVLEASGEQWTPLRAAVFASLANFAAPVSAYDVVEAVSSTQGRRLAATSIYRILDLFTATNLATKVESENAFIVNAHPQHRHDCIFLVCDGCGRTNHLDSDDTVDRLRIMATATGFRVDRPVMELRGRCKDCV